MMHSMLKSCSKLQPVTGEATTAYERICTQLVDQVNAALEANPEIQRLIGHNPLEIMRANHRNHATFMLTVFRLSAYPLLAGTIPWAYRVYHARGFTFDYFPVALAAWEQALTSGLEAEHRPAILAVYAWMQEHHRQMVQLALAGEGGYFLADTVEREVQQQFLELLLKGNSRGCLALAETAMHSKEAIKQLYLQVICPSLGMIGYLWETNKLSVAEEHLATAIVGRVMSAIYPHIACIDATLGKVLVTAAPNELHEVGARMVADFFEMEGWYVDYLGAGIPGYEIVAAVKRIKPLFVALSVTTVFNLDRAQELVAALKADIETSSVRIMVGGSAFNGMQDLWRTIGADGYVPDAAAALDLANSWLCEGAD
jgi:methanogenic corrinoid protein MtbC1